MMTRLLILSCMTFWAGGMLSAEPALAPHLSIPFKDTGKGYHDRLPWAVSYLPKFDWSKKFGELEDHRRRVSRKVWMNWPSSSFFRNNASRGSATPTNASKP